jgi:flagellar biosynthesis protein FlhF
MKIQRYTAASMRVALAQIRAEQGPDAVILSSRRIDEGIEVVAAVDYDESLMLEAMRPRAPVEERPAEARPADAWALDARPADFHAEAPPGPEAGDNQAPARPPRRAEDDSDYGLMRRELKDVRRLLENELAGLTWNDKRLRDPLKVRVLEDLTALDMAPDVAKALAELTPRSTELENPSKIPLALLFRQLPVVNDKTCISGGILAVVGPTGVGKTTTIAKLAAHWSMQHGSDDLALVSTDGYRIGAREQLLTYARILGAPMHTANDGRELAQVLDRLTSKKLVLIDTAGMGPRDARLAEQLAALQSGAARARVLLALPAHGEGNALEEIVGAFANFSPAACVLTKVDEAASLGAALSTAIRHRLPIAYLCNGQRVPEDLHDARQNKNWLVQLAVKLKEGAPPRQDETYMAHHFGRGQAHV